MTVAGVAGNTSVEVSMNGQDFTSSMVLVERVALANVTSVAPAVVPVGGGSVVVVRGIGLSAYSGAGAYCGYGASSASESWSVVRAEIMAASGVLRCLVAARGAAQRDPLCVASRAASSKPTAQPAERASGEKHRLAARLRNHVAPAS